MLTLGDILKATNGRLADNEKSADTAFSGISIDSRTIKNGELFIALKGDRFDGHDFVADALSKGSGAVIKDGSTLLDDNKFNGKAVIIVDDTLIALHSMANYARRRFKGHVLGVAGSNGKTTTKELISSVLGVKLKAHKTPGNLNNHIGMPLVIISAETDSDAMVLEMGANRPGDIDELCTIAMPDIGVITNIGYEHLQGFGSLETVRDSELEILRHIKTLVANADDAFLMEGVMEMIQNTTNRLNLITFGITSENTDLSARDIVISEDGAIFLLSAGSDEIKISSRLSGLFNVYNCLAAASAAHALGFSLQEIKKGLESFQGIKMRFKIIRHKGATYLCDVYNANPSSMEEAIKELARLVSDNKNKYKRAIAVLGDMLELGDYETSSHKAVGQRLSELPVDIFVGVGPLMAAAVSEFRRNGISVDTSGLAAAEIEKIVREGDIVLVKGSRGMKMEQALYFLEESGHVI